MNFRIECESPDIQLRKAILLYGSEGDVSHATINLVAEGRSGKMEIQPGQLLTLEGLTSALHGLAKGAAGTGWSLLEPNTVASGIGMTAWWSPACHRQMYFAPSTKIPSGVAAQPPLFWLLKGGQLYVWAMRESARPDENTELFNPVHFNCYRRLAVCWGTGRKPDSSRPSAWMDAFYGSAFTHSNDGEGWQLAGKGSPAKLWKQLVQQGTEGVFPIARLASADLTVREVLGGNADEY